MKITDAGLKTDLQNANEGTQRGRGLLEKSLRQLGAGRSILVDKSGNVIAGNKTLEGAAELDLPVRIIETDGKELVVVKRTDLDLYSEDDKRARTMAYADNKIAELDLAWRPEQIEVDFQPLELEGWGFEPSSASTTQNPDESESLKLSELIALQEKWGVKVNQLWKIKNNYVFCGDSTDKEKINKLFTVCEKPNFMIYDPDWDDKIVFPEFDWRGIIAYSDGFRSRDIIQKFGLPAWVFVWDGYTSWYTPNRPLRRAKLALWFGDIELYNFNGAHYGDSGEDHDVKNTRGSYHFVPDPRGKHLSDVFSMSLPHLHSEGFHPYEKPVDWVRMLIGNCFPGDSVYDPFLGCGNTAIACEQLGKSCVGVEIEPMYVAYLIEQLSSMGLEPEHVNDL